MHRFVRKSLSLTQIRSWASYSPTGIRSPPPCLHSHKSLCTDVNNITSSTNQQTPFTVRDLINSCGFSHKLVTRLESSTRPDSVLAFLQNYGFSRTQIETLVSKKPGVLCNCVERTLKPKIDFFRSVGCSEADTVRILTIAPYILDGSVKNHLIPSFELLITTLGGQQNAVDALKNYPLIICCKRAKDFALNVKYLMNVGTPITRVMKMITQNRAGVVAINSPHRFRKDVEFVMEMGFDPSLSMFIYAIKAKGCLTELGWEDRLKFFRSLGFSYEETICMFKKQPITMSLSKGKIRAAVEFYTSTFHWSPTQLSKKPNVLLYSLGKRIIPRCSVLQILVSRSMIDKGVTVSVLKEGLEGRVLAA